MNKQDLDQIVQDMGDEIMLMDGFEEAFIGFSRRCGQPTLASYSFDKMVDVLIERDSMDPDEAMEYIEYNCVGAWMGPMTPVVVYEYEGGVSA